MTWTAANITNLVIAVTGLAGAIAGIITAYKAHVKANIATITATEAKEIANGAATNGGLHAPEPTGSTTNDPAANQG